ncbi:hypothetical protein ZOSMA_11G01150 [Zostera marina]|uniref:Uncharacterized protein n=1 Tax=Zostera marina TaxID=29655 RepID=A0A0K9Q3K0_ZOSMR|nr:hypothetical protein ZOSMA_11G01150 [Zostera marina]
MLALTITTLFLLSSASPTLGKRKITPVPVLDVDGKPLQAVDEYYVIPAEDAGMAGGIGLGKLKTTCEINVAEDFTPEGIKTNGISVRFFPANSNDTVVSLSSDVNVVLSWKKSVCGKSPVWKLGGYETTSGKWFVVVGGEVGFPSTSTLSNWFKIGKFDDDEKTERYKFFYCPHICKYCKVVCGDIGVVGNDGLKRLLGISHVPATFVFKRKKI